MARNNFEDEGWEDLFASRNGGTKEFEDRYPLSTTRLHQDQCDDVQLCRTVEESISKNEFKYTYKEVEGRNLIHQQGKILVPAAARERILDWYHTMLVHPGRDRMYQTIRTNFYWKGMRNDVIKHCKTCHICQKAKKTNKLKYGLLPEKEGEVTKWSRVNVDLW